jgi:hypothetical protein
MDTYSCPIREEFNLREKFFSDSKTAQPLALMSMADGLGNAITSSQPARMFGPYRRGRTFEFGQLSEEIDSDEFHRYHLSLEKTRR